MKEACKSVYWLGEYIKRQEYFLGLSYGLSFAFIVFAFLKFREDKKDALKAAMGGSLWTLILFFFCFLFGCCSSPMLIMYLNLIGISNLKVPKSVLLLITVIYICIGYFWLIKRTSKSISNKESCKKIKNEKI
jgi:membrane protease YdiL (CAAX protease family)